MPHPPFAKPSVALADPTLETTVFYNFNLYNSYYHRCECHRFFEASPSEPPYAQRYTAGHEVDYLTIGSDTPSGCNNPDNKAQYEALCALSRCLG